MAIKESYIKVKEVIIKTPSAGSVSNSSNIAGVIVSPVGPKLAYITSPSEFLATYTVDGETIPRNADTTFINAYYLSYFTGLVLVRSMNTSAVGGFAVTNELSNNIIPVVFKDGQLLTKSTSVTFETEKSMNGSEPNWYLKINDYGFYHGTLPSAKYEEADAWVELDSLSDLGSALERFDEFHAVSSLVTAPGGKIAVKVDISHNLSQKILVSDLHLVDIQTYTSETGVFELEDTVIDTSNWLFTVKGDVPLQSNSRKAKITEVTSDNEGDKFNLVIDDDTYLVSLNPDRKDKNGVNMYIEYINTLGVGLEVTVYNVGDYSAPSPSSEVTLFGASGFSQTDSKLDSNIISAVNYLAEQEVFDVEYLAPMGLTSLPVISTLMLVSRDKKWFCPIDVPYEYTSYTEVKRFSNLVSSSDIYFNDSNQVPGSILLGPFDRNTSLTGWVNKIAASTLYYERVMNNKGQNAEFAPVFKSTYGTVNYTNPTKLFLKTERENLLNLNMPVNWTVYDQKSDSYYINDNRTGTPDQTSVVCEEQNSRIVWKISKDIDKILDQFISQYNTKATRARVVDVLDYYFKWTIMNQQFPPDDYEIICDETINSPEVINANKLAVIVKVRLYKAIKYIEVTNKVYPLGVDFNRSL